ncbi:uncharacterized protein LOC131401099 [Diceros bicornis minor]|uniref:uncharacterized protein LOC131401099 n=1 Tax=Diceros bicornis minor TaxID=77932 RepID=UPI0026EA1264|nr:uncharacterized protein LOC131401099 [Diceros bicornis minor]
MKGVRREAPSAELGLPGDNKQLRGPSEDEEPPPQGIPGGGGHGPAPSGDGRERQLGWWQEDTGGPTLAILSRTRPPNHGQAPAPAAPTFSRRSGLCSPPPPPPAPIHSPLKPRPQPPGGGTGIHQGQSPPRLSSPGTNPRRLGEGLLQCHLGSSRGPRIPFVWGEPSWD